MIRTSKTAALIGIVFLAWSAAAAGEAMNDVEGVARVAATSRPVAHLTLRFSSREKSGGDVVSDANGHFIVKSLAVDPEEAPQCWVLAQDHRRWPWDVLKSVGHDEAHARGQIEEHFMHEAKTRWERVDGSLRLVVDCPPMGEVEVLVRDPNGAAMKDQAVSIVPAVAPGAFGEHASPRFNGRTDREGRFRMRAFTGRHRLRVLIPGLGFGSTGEFDILAGEVTKPEMPPLVRYGEIRGRLEPGFTGPGLTVSVGYSKAWSLVEAPCDDDGRFVLRDVVPGPRLLQVWRGRSSFSIESSHVSIAPGAKVEGVALRMRTRPHAVPPGFARFAHPRGANRADGKAEEIDWVEGHLQDDQGRAVGKAEVIALTAVHGGIRMYDEIRTATSGDDGHFRLRGPELDFMGSLTIVAHSAGRPPVVAYYPSPDRKHHARPPLTITFASKGATAAVAVIKDGKPAPKAMVKLSLEGIGFEPWVVRFANRADLDKQTQPTSQAGPDGVARFESLLPGSYRVVAVDCDGDIKRTGWGRDPSLVFGENVCLAVTSGDAAQVSVAIHRQPGSVRYQVVRPGGEPARDQAISFAFGLKEAHSRTHSQLDGHGFGTHDFETPGLWSIGAEIGDSVSTPHVLVPVSPGFSLGPPITLRAVRRDDHGSLRIQLIGADGLPARGVIALTEPGEGFDEAGTTNDLGVVRFAGMRAGHYDLRGYIDGLAPPPFVDPSGPLPDEPLLRSARVVRSDSVGVKSGKETRVELQTEPVGYLRGVIRPPDGHAASEFSAFVKYPGRQYPDTRWRMDGKTGRYSLGPLPAGPLTLKLQQEKGELLLEAGSQSLEVVPGAAAEVDLRPHDARNPEDDEEEQDLPGMGGLSRFESSPARLAGSVFLADGVTPAFAAQALLFVPGNAEATVEGISDATGRFTFQSRSYMVDPEDLNRPSLVTKPTFVIRLPGLTGATIITEKPGIPLRAVLPTPISASGRVTLGGRPFINRNARVHIVAAHQGQRVLDSALGVEASAQPDGRFVLAGLTPGRYVVQAARDGIWLSSALELVAEEGKAPPPLSLDIPEPGQTIALEVVDADGRPMAAETLSLVRPEGPLKSLWPVNLQTDPEGVLIVRGLEAGQHTVLVGDRRTPHEIRVPEAGATASQPVVTRIVVKPTIPAPSRD